MTKFKLKTEDSTGFNPCPKKGSIKQKKGAMVLKQYGVNRKVYLAKAENKSCKILSDKCTLKATTIEHTRGRGLLFVDIYAAENNIPLTLDQRFWLPSCLNCNLELENNGELSKKHQLSKIHGGKKF